MLSYPPAPADFDFHHTLAPFAQGEDLPFAEVLTCADMERFCAELEVSFGTRRGSFWTPALTLGTWLLQVLGADKSCRQAVANVFLTLALSVEPTDLDTGAYCRARAKLPVAILRRLTTDLADATAAGVPSGLAK